MCNRRYSLSMCVYLTWHSLVYVSSSLSRCKQCTMTSCKDNSAMMTMSMVCNHERMYTLKNQGNLQKERSASIKRNNKTKKLS